MEIALNTSFSHALRAQAGEAAVLTAMAQAGFRAAELSLDTLSREDSPWAGENWQAHADALAAHAQSLGIRFHQARAPHAFQWLRRDTHALDALVYPAMERALAICARMGIPRLVVEPMTHPIVLNIATWKQKVNVQFFQTLGQLARPFGVEVAATNLVRAFETARELLALGPDLAVCVDPGRCFLSAQSAPEMLLGLGSRVAGVYLSGNHGLRDQRCIPGQEELDWDAILETLGKIGYDGPLTLLLSQEETGCLDGAHGFGLDFIPCVLELARESAAYLAAKGSARKGGSEA